MQKVVVSVSQKLMFMTSVQGAVVRCLKTAG